MGCGCDTGELRILTSKEIIEHDYMMIRLFH